MSRSKDPKCPNGRDCGTCNWGKDELPVRDQRRLPPADLEDECTALSELDWMYYDDVDYSAPEWYWWDELQSQFSRPEPLTKKLVE